MPPVVIAAGVAAAGSIVGGAMSSSAAKNAAKTQASTANQQIAANNANRAQILGLSQPNIDRGNAASDIYAGLLNVGGDPAKSAAALSAYRNSTGYQDLLNTGLGAVNSSAYARGMGDSGATAKALQKTGQAYANQNTQQYLGNLNTLIQTGNSAIGNVAGVNTNTTQMNNAALQNSADASSNATLMSSAGWQNALKNLTNVGVQAAGTMGSSYGNGGLAPVGQSNFQTPIFDAQTNRYGGF